MYSSTDPIALLGLEHKKYKQTNNKTKQNRRNRHLTFDSETLIISGQVSSVDVIKPRSAEMITGKLSSSSISSVTSPGRR